MEEDDRIGLLPLDIKISILSCLEIRDAIRTSAVARSWRHLWTLLPCLRIDYRDDKLGFTSDDHTTSSSWMERVHQLVSSLHGPLLHFELSHRGLPFFYDDPSALFQSLLDLLLQKGGLETLDLYINNTFYVVIHLPSFPSLKVLELNGCYIILPAGFHGFNRLASLALNYVKISNDDLNLLIHTSNNLTTLVKLDCEVSEEPLSVNLSLPLMRHLEFDINDSVEEVVIYAPCLEEARFSLYRRDCSSEKLARMTRGLVTSVARVSSLELYFDVLKLVSDHPSQTNRVAILMRELLVKKHDGFACLDQTLRNVTIGMCKSDVIASIAMIQFFLLNANVLKLLTVEYSDGDEDAVSMIKELQKADRASLDAKVVIFDRFANLIFT